MQTSLTGRTILIVEDETLIGLDLVGYFERAGASVLWARTLAEANSVAEQSISAAVVDFGLRDGEANGLCHQLTSRGTPFILHSGYSHTDKACTTGLVIPKPADPTKLVGALADLLRAKGGIDASSQ